MSKTSDSVAFAYLALLAERGVPYLFGNAGTDFAPIVEAYTKGAQAGANFPRPDRPKAHRQDENAPC
jgi:acetolactate synthase I/II/III large subunit